MKRHLTLTLAGLLIAAAAAADEWKPPDACKPQPLPPNKLKHEMSDEATLVNGPVPPEWFIKDPCYPDAYNAKDQLDIYGAKHENPNPTGVPPVEIGIRLYDRGAYTPRPTWLFGAKNPVHMGFMSYGDLRLVGADYDNGGTGAKGQQSAIAARLNLDMDLQLTATERIHAFTRPLDKNGSFTRYDIDGAVNDKFIHNFDFNLETLFMEGDVGAILGGWRDKPSKFDMPFALGRFPFVTQNGVWIEDAFEGAAATIAAKNIPSLDVSNYDITFFTGLRKVSTAAITNSDDNTKIFGLAGFADARNGYIEFGYGYVKADNDDLSYHNLTASFSRRYKGRLANSVRVIGNFGQQGIAGTKTADGVLLLVENSILPRFTPKPSDFNVSNFVPYVNLFAGFNSPQSLARGGDSGGVLRNTGLAFESDGVTAYPTLDATAHDTYGGSVGLEYLFDLFHQLVVEGSVVQRRGDSPLPGNEYALGARYQHPFTKDLIIRLDAMKGWRQGQKDIYGARVELRLKF
jgi:hypothetical protein